MKNGNGLKILQLQMENIKRVVVADISPTGNVVNITGRNGQGKTSVLDAIWWALEGTTNIQSRPIRDGATEGRIRLKLGNSGHAPDGTEVEVIVTRTFKAAPDNPKGYTTSLKVEGNVSGSPQQFLDSLLSTLTFDPMEFMRLDPAAQYKLFQEFVPGVDFAAMEAANAVDYSNRAELNKTVVKARTAANNIAIPADAAITRVDETALVQQIADAAKTNGDILARQQNRQKYAADAADARKKIAELQAQMEALARQIETLDAEAVKKEEALRIAAPLPPIIDVTAVQDAIAKAKIANAQMDQRDLKTNYDKTAAEAEAESQALTASIKKRTDEITAKIAAAQMPIEGITFGDKVVLFNGLPLNQAADAEQLRVSALVAISKNPKLRVIRIRMGSLIDNEGKRVIARIADEKDFQIWMETVDSSGTIGFVLEDGHSRNAEAPAAATTTAASAQTSTKPQPLPAAIPADIL